MSCPAWQGVPYYLNGLDFALYGKPTKYPHRNVVHRKPIWSGAHILFKIVDGKAGATEATANMKTVECDQIGLTYLQIKRCAISGKEVSSAHSCTPYASYTNSARKRAARAAADKIASATLDSRDYRGQDPAVMRAAAMREFMLKQHGCVQRVRQDWELEDREDRRRHRRSSRRRERSRHRSSRHRDEGEGEDIEEAGELVDDSRSHRTSRSHHTSRSRRSTGTARSARSARSTGGETVDPRKQKHSAHFISGWPYAFFSTGKVMAGNYHADTAVGLAVKVLDGVNVSKSFRDGLAELTEQVPDTMTREKDRRELLTVMSSKAATVYLHLPFFYSRKELNLGINRCACEWAQPHWSFTFADVTSLVKRSDEFTKVVKKNGQELSNEDVTAKLLIHCRMLDPTERDYLNEQPHDVIAMVHNIKTETGTGGMPKSISLPWDGPTVALSFIVRRQCNVKDGEPWNWWGLFGEEPIKSASFTCGDRFMQPEMDATYWRLLVPMERGNACPAGASYHWAAGMSLNPLGVDTSVTLPRYNSAAINVVYQDYLTTETLEFVVIRTGIRLHRYAKQVMVPVEQGEGVGSGMSM